MLKNRLFWFYFKLTFIYIVFCAK